MAPHIVAIEAGVAIELEKVDLKSGMTETGRRFSEINPKGYIPALELDGGALLTEGPAILQYLETLGEQHLQQDARDPLHTARLQEWLAFINSELHKAYATLFSSDTTPETRVAVEARLRVRYALIEQTLARQPYLLGTEFSSADAYLFVVTNWAAQVHLDLSGFPALQQFQGRVVARPAVQAAIAAENRTASAAA